MASSSSSSSSSASAKNVSFSFLVLLISTCFMVHIQAGDPDIIADFIAPNTSSIDGSFFTFNGLRSVFSEFPDKFKPTKASLAEFPALFGQSVSMAVLQYPAGAINPPHSHPRSAELLFVVGGTLQVGFVDTANKFYNQTLQLGDIFLFPKGLVHFQFNPDSQIPATAISAFGSVSAGTVSVPSTVFGSGISDDVLAKSFKIDVSFVENIKAALAVPN